MKPITLILGNQSQGHGAFSQELLDVYNDFICVAKTYGKTREEAKALAVKIREALAAANRPTQ